MDNLLKDHRCPILSRSLRRDEINADLPRDARFRSRLRRHLFEAWASARADWIIHARRCCQSLILCGTITAMLWQGRPLREIRDADIQRLVDSGLEEHLQLEYKSELYDDSDRGRKEFLLDICMFANTAGGVLLIGIPERRDGPGQPTGVPDSGAVLGIEIANPEAVLGGYDARVMEAIEERLPLESAAIDVGSGRRAISIFRLVESVSATT